MAALSSEKWLLYGANGYTGKLLAREAARLGLNPTLAGRDEASVSAVARELGLAYEIFDLKNPRAIAERIKGFRLVFLAAGPYVFTSAPMVEACLLSGVDYVDITGEISVFEHIFSLKDRAVENKCAFLPGIGFDVVPTDCIAQKLKEALPSATELELSISGSKGVSPGTLKSMITSTPGGGWVRRKGRLTPIPLFSLGKLLRIRGKEIFSFAIPWGDISTAFFSTQIPNITVFAQADAWLLKIPSGIRPKLPRLIALPGIRHTALKLIPFLVKGPNEADRNKGKMVVWGRVSDPQGQSAEAVVEVPEGYTFTVKAATNIVQRLLKSPLSPGVYTPSLAFGSDLIDQLPHQNLSLNKSP